MSIKSVVRTLILAVLSVGLASNLSAKPIDSRAAKDLNDLASILKQPIMMRKISPELESKYIGLANDKNSYAEKQVAILTLAWGNDSKSLEILKSIKHAEGSYSGEASYALLVRENRDKGAEELCKSLIAALESSKNPFERMFIANRLAVDFPSQAVVPILRAVNNETDWMTKIDLTYYLSVLCDRTTATVVLQLDWKHIKDFELPESLASLMQVLTPGRGYGDDEIYNSIRRLNRTADPGDKDNTIFQNILIDNVMFDVVPDDMQSYRKIKSAGSDKEVLVAALNLVQKTREIWISRENDMQSLIGDRSHAGLAYSMSWSLVIELMNSTKDPNVKAEILKEWDTALSDKSVQWQVSSLRKTWNRELLTQSFIKLFRETNDPKLICEFTSVFGDHGEIAEEKLLKEKLQLLPKQMDTKSKDFETCVKSINWALRSIGYWKNGDETRMGPNALQSALNATLVAAPAKELPLHNAIHQLFSRLRDTGREEPNLLIESDYAANIYMKGAIPQGTMKSQLDVIAASTGYSWTTNGNWLEFIPKGRENDPNYVLNKRLPGKIIVSRVSGKETPIKDWLKQNGINIGMSLSGIRAAIKIEKPSLGPDTIEMNNPTLREAIIAHEAVNGNNVLVARVSGGYILASSYCTRELIYQQQQLSAGKATQPEPFSLRSMFGGKP